MKRAFTLIELLVKSRTHIVEARITYHLSK